MFRWLSFFCLSILFFTSNPSQVVEAQNSTSIRFIIPIEQTSAVSSRPWADDTDERFAVAQQIIRSLWHYQHRFWGNQRNIEVVVIYFAGNQARSVIFPFPNTPILNLGQFAELNQLNEQLRMLNPNNCYQTLPCGQERFADMLPVARLVQESNLLRPDATRFLWITSGVVGSECNIADGFNACLQNNLFQQLIQLNGFGFISDTNNHFFLINTEYIRDTRFSQIWEEQFSNVNYAAQLPREQLDPNDNDREGVILQRRLRALMMHTIDTQIKNLFGVQYLENILHREQEARILRVPAFTQDFYIATMYDLGNQTGQREGLRIIQPDGTEYDLSTMSNQFSHYGDYLHIRYPQVGDWLITKSTFASNSAEKPQSLWGDRDSILNNGGSIHYRMMASSSLNFITPVPNEQYFEYEQIQIAFEVETSLLDALPSDWQVQVRVVSCVNANCNSASSVVLPDTPMVRQSFNHGVTRLSSVFVPSDAPLDAPNRAYYQAFVEFTFSNGEKLFESSTSAFDVVQIRAQPYCYNVDPEAPPNTYIQYPQPDFATPPTIINFYPGQQSSLWWAVSVYALNADGSRLPIKASYRDNNALNIQALVGNTLGQDTLPEFPDGVLRYRQRILLAGTPSDLSVYQVSFNLSNTPNQLPVPAHGNITSCTFLQIPRPSDE